MGVLVRLRPITSAEASSGQTCAWSHELDRLWQSAPAGPGRTLVPQQAYVFDRVFGPEDSTRRIFEERVRTQVSRTLLGYNSTIFAYGQTSSGKTTTIRGRDSVEGLISLSTQMLLSAIDADQRPSVSYKLKMSYLEIYNENVQDLLSGCERAAPRGGHRTLHGTHCPAASPTRAGGRVSAYMRRRAARLSCRICSRRRSPTGARSKAVPRSLGRSPDRAWGRVAEPQGITSYSTTLTVDHHAARSRPQEEGRGAAGLGRRAEAHRADVAQRPEFSRAHGLPAHRREHCP